MANVVKLEWALCWEVAEESMVVSPLCPFWIIMQEKNRRALENEEFLEQLLRSFFMCSFLDIVRHFIGETCISMADFVNWLGSY